MLFPTEIGGVAVPEKFLKGPKGKPVIGWFCRYTPVEVIAALGGFPYRLYGTSQPVQAADSYLPTNFCPYVRSCLESALRGENDFLDGLVVVNSCNAMTHLCNTWQHYLHPPFIYLLDLPRTSKARAVSAFARTVAIFASSLSAYLGSPLTFSALQETRHLYGELYSLLRELYHQHQTLSLLKEEELLLLLRLATNSPVEEFIPFLTQSFPHWKKFLAQRKVKQERKVLLAGNSPPLEFVSFLEELGAEVVADELCVGWRLVAGQEENDAVLPVSFPGEEEELPFLALAQDILRRPPCPRMKHAASRKETLLSLYRASGAAGVIYYHLKFCDLDGYDALYLREACLREGIPFLLLEGDYTCGGQGQIQTRVEAFLETLEEAHARQKAKKTMARPAI